MNPSGRAPETVWRVVEPRAVWGFVVVGSRVVDAAPYGRARVLGKRLDQALNILGIDRCAAVSSRLAPWDYPDAFLLSVRDALLRAGRDDLVHPTPMTPTQPQ